MKVGENSGAGKLSVLSSVNCPVMSVPNSPATTTGRAWRDLVAKSSVGLDRAPVHQGASATPAPATSDVGGAKTNGPGEATAGVGTESGARPQRVQVAYSEVRRAAGWAGRGLRGALRWMYDHWSYGTVAFFAALFIFFLTLPPFVVNKKGLLKGRPSVVRVMLYALTFAVGVALLVQFLPLLRSVFLLVVARLF